MIPSFFAARRATAPGRTGGRRAPIVACQGAAPGLALAWGKGGGGLAQYPFT